MKIDLNKFPFVFWIKISIRIQWFSYWWKSRGSNFIDLQIWIFKISIGLPWIVDVLDSHLYYYGDLHRIKNTNEFNKRSKFSFQIGSYNKFKSFLNIK